MPIDIADVFDILTVLCDDENLRISVKESLKSGAIVGTATTVGAVLGGPVGVAIGGIVGTVGATYYARGRFKPLSQVLREMPKDQKQILYDKAVNIINGLSVEDAALLGKLILNDPGIRTELVSVVVDHVSKQMHLQIID